MTGPLFQILGLGTAVPGAGIAQSTLAVAAERCTTISDDAIDSRSATPVSKVSRIYAGTMIRQRSSVLTNGQDNDNQATLMEQIQAFYPPRRDDEHFGPSIADRMRRYAIEAPQLAVESCRDALTVAEINPPDVAQLIVVSCTGFSAPGVDVALIKQLGLKPDVGRTMIGFMGCHGAINGLRVAQALAAVQPGQPVLLCCVELCSLHFQYGTDAQQMVANALFADGAAAVVGIGGSDGPPAPKRSPIQLVDCTSRYLPASESDMRWDIRDHGFEMRLSLRVPKLVRENIEPWLRTWLNEEHGLSIDQIAHWAIHPGGPRIIDAVAEALALSDQATTPSRAILAEHGNMSSPTVLFILDHFRRQNLTRGNDYCVMLAFGPGLMMEAALLQV